MSMPVSTSTATARYNSGVRNENEKFPVSVIIPTYNDSAILRVIACVPNNFSRIW